MPLTSLTMRCCCSTSIPRRPFADGTPVVRHSLSRTSLIVQTETKQCAAGGWVQLEGTADLTGGLKVVGVIKAMASSPANFAIAGFSVSDDGNVVVNVTRISSGTPVDVHAYLTIKVSKA